MTAPVSSSSSATDDFASFLDESMCLLEDDVPLAYATMCARLGACRVLVAIGDERCVIASDGSRVVVSPPDPGCDDHVTIRTRAATLLRLLDGRVTLVEAMRTGDVRLSGDLPELVRFSHALDAYLGGCLRSPAAPLLLSRYVGSTTEVSA